MVEGPRGSVLLAPRGLLRCYFVYCIHCPCTGSRCWKYPQSWTSRLSKLKRDAESHFSNVLAADSSWESSCIFLGSVWASPTASPTQNCSLSTSNLHKAHGIKLCLYCGSPLQEGANLALLANGTGSSDCKNKLFRPPSCVQ